MIHLWTKWAGQQSDPLSPSCLSLFNFFSGSVLTLSQGEKWGSSYEGKVFGGVGLRKRKWREQKGKRGTEGNSRYKQSSGVILSKNIPLTRKDALNCIKSKIQTHAKDFHVCCISSQRAEKSTFVHFPSITWEKDENLNLPVSEPKLWLMSQKRRGPRCLPGCSPLLSVACSQRCLPLLKLLSVRCEWTRGGGGEHVWRWEEAQKREGGREGEKGGREGRRIIGQVWNLHTLLVACLLRRDESSFLWRGGGDRVKYKGMKRFSNNQSNLLSHDLPHRV